MCYPLCTLIKQVLPVTMSSSRSAGPTAMGKKPSRGGHLPINGLNLYYEVHGDLAAPGIPLLLIPGAFMAADSMPAWVDAFSRDRAVIVFDQQGHGRTPDTARTMSYEQFGDDAAELLRALGVRCADVMGYSQGGGAALQLAIRHPSLVSKLVAMSATFHRDGWHPAVAESIAAMTAADFAGTPLHAAFAAHTPEAGAFDAYLEKMKALNINDQQITEEQMRAIPAKTMVIVGDADSVVLEHALAMFRLCGGADDGAAKTGVLQSVPQARLVVQPATSHIGISGQADVLVPLVTAFLDDVPPVTPELF
ncbi:MAG: putative hydrolase or acyltransferase of alpha/beta superfamily [Mycobacterium sp.]|nr:putative hydrolase or acyltransferase of alpha/beta superfamily [Mycobacterium sp.]